MKPYERKTKFYRCIEKGEKYNISLYIARSFMFYHFRPKAYHQWQCFYKMFTNKCLHPRSATAKPILFIIAPSLTLPSLNIYLPCTNNNFICQTDNKIEKEEKNLTGGFRGFIGQECSKNTKVSNFECTPRKYCNGTKTSVLVLIV